MFCPKKPTLRSIKSGVIALAVGYRKISVLRYDNQTEHFLNIKFAYDTSRPRRFAPPEPLIPSEGSGISANEPGPACPQSKAGLPPFFDKTPVTSEDCLSLRVTRASGTAAIDKKPVVVWLYGGPRDRFRYT
ncbi:hypothetical protein NPX13_g1622 [Xylaria arbuscula]|uniref:Carboxylesterase type B domain-containing protein n=1 Tax=Xylaria arbuscula TaxID=114810 RepID=A0A9W8NL28_9PEZI|nr:hypothetical protein NPX13_g1622 [Xylaria arbuscula]